MAAARKGALRGRPPARSPLIVGLAVAAGVAYAEPREPPGAARAAAADRLLARLAWPLAGLAVKRSRGGAPGPQTSTLSFGDGREMANACNKPACGGGWR